MGHADEHSISSQGLRTPKPWGLRQRELCILHMKAGPVIRESRNGWWEGTLQVSIISTSLHSDQTLYLSKHSAMFRTLAFPWDNPHNKRNKRKNGHWLEHQNHMNQVLVVSVTDYMTWGKLLLQCHSRHLLMGIIST